MATFSTGSSRTCSNSFSLENVVRNQVKQNLVSPLCQSLRSQGHLSCSHLKAAKHGRAGLALGHVSTTPPPPELFSIISFCFLTTWICLSIIIISIESVTLRTKWATGSSGYEPTGGSREQRGASEAWAAPAAAPAAAPGKLFRSLESESCGLELED